MSGDDIQQEVRFDAPPARVYEALMNPEQHAEFTGGGAAEISQEAGGAFSAHGGRVGGRNIELVQDQRIVQAWRSGNWPEGLYSMLRFELEADNGGTKLTMTHSGVPGDSRDGVSGSWTSLYWEPLAAYLG